MKLANNKKKSDMPYKMEPLVPIPSYAPHDTLTAKGYEIPSVLIKFEENFELRCREIIKNGKLDQYNKGYMDGLHRETGISRIGGTEGSAQSADGRSEPS